MPYTLLNFALWFALAALIGGVIGWLLRSLTCRAEVAGARTGHVAGAEATGVRHRVADDLDAAIDAPGDGRIAADEAPA